MPYVPSHHVGRLAGAVVLAPREHPKLPTPLFHPWYIIGHLANAPPWLLGRGAGVKPIA